MDTEIPSPEDITPVPVDLEELADALEGDPLSAGGVLDLDTGEVWPECVIEYARETEGEDWDERIERPLGIDRLGSRAAYEDMCEFIDDLDDARLVEKLTIAVRGRGAFSRFKDVLGEADPDGLEAYYAMARERKLGRAAAWLAENGYRAVPSQTAAAEDHRVEPR
jgi:hypothetical protein